MQWLGTALAALSLAAALPPPASAEPNWSLVWSDEFDDSSLPDWIGSGDEGLGGSLWQPENNGWGGGNQELQFYTPRESNVFVEDGKLTISGIKEVYASSQCPQWTYSCDDDDRVTVTKQYTSARIHTDWCGLDVGFGYGKFEMRAKMPVGKGTFHTIS
jgi:beta-glucanase (GH16 family)